MLNLHILDTMSVSEFIILALLVGFFILETAIIVYVIGLYTMTLACGWFISCYITAVAISYIIGFWEK